MNTSPISAKKHHEEERVMDEDIDMGTSAEVKQAHEGDEDKTMGADGGAYIVESILDHRMDFEDDKTRYLVKWKDYDESEQTWELEDRFVGSPDVLEAYWEKVGGKPDQKKKGRDRSASKDVEKAVTVESAVDGSGDWLPPVPSVGNWDALVQNVETLDTDEEGALLASLLWNEKNKDGGPLRTQASIWTCYLACPQKMLDFFERHTVRPKRKASEMLRSSAAKYPQMSGEESEDGLAEDVNDLV